MMVVTVGQIGANYQHNSHEKHLPEVTHQHALIVCINLSGHAILLKVFFGQICLRQYMFSSINCRSSLALEDRLFRFNTAFFFLFLFSTTEKTFDWRSVFALMLAEQIAEVTHLY